MVDFPVLVLRELFTVMGIAERLRARSVCKKWKFVIDSLDPQKSVCIYSGSFPYKRKWCFSNMKIAEEELLYMNFWPVTIRKFSLRMKCFRHLEKVALYDIDERADCFLNEVGQLAKLKVLMIHGRKIWLKKISSLSLEKFFLQCQYTPERLELNFPNMSSLYSWINMQGDLRICFPSTVKHLECKNFDQSLTCLENLETLVCQRLFEVDIPLEKFKHLTRLEIWPDEYILKRVMQIEKKRRLLGRDHLELIVCGFKGQIVSRSEWCGEALSASYLELIKRDRSKFVGSVLRFAGLEFATIAKYAKTIPKGLLEDSCIMAESPFTLKGSDISSFDLIEGLKSCRPKYLQIGNLSLPRQFCEQLHLVESISYLEIRIPKYFDYNCLLKFKSLPSIRLHSEFQIPAGFICKLVKEQLFRSFVFCSLPSSEFPILSSKFPVSSSKLSIYIVSTDTSWMYKKYAGHDNQFEFCYSYSYKGSQVRIRRICQDVHELVEEVNKMQTNKQIQQCFV